jgi:hypothetical protein
VPDAPLLVLPDGEHLCAEVVPTTMIADWVSRGFGAYFSPRSNAMSAKKIRVWQVWAFGVPLNKFRGPKKMHFHS